MRKETKVDEKQLVADLQKANDELKLRATILDMAYDAILMYSPDAKLLYANEAAARLYGYVKEELNNFNVTQLIPPQEISAYEIRARTILEQGSLNAEIIHQRKDGSLITVELPL